MKQFAALYRELDASTSNLVKQAALQRYLQAADPEDAAWAVYFLAGGRPRQLVPTKLLRLLAQQAAGLPEWLFDESYEAVGDLAETLSLLLPPPTEAHDLGLATWIEQHLLPLRGMPPEPLAGALRAQWRQLAPEERLVYFKLITGAFRVGVSRLQVTQVLAAMSGLDPKRVAQRLMGYTHITGRPGAADFAALIAPESGNEQDRRAGGQPYPFFLAHPFALPLEQFDAVMGPPSQWLIEWKWDGIRAQLVRRAGQVCLWSRGEELVTDRFPELAEMGRALPDGTVLDGEIVVWRDDRAQPFADLQKRIGRKTLGPKLLREIPVVVLAYDLLEWEGRDLRALPQHERRVLLDDLIATAQHPALIASPMLHGESWQDLARQRESSRAMGVEGMMLKQRHAAYGVGRTKDVGLWWKWKIDPLSVDAVLVYAQRGHGRRASLYSDYTFAVWDAPPEVEGRMLVPFAKAYSGLSDAEMARVDAIIRRTTIESFGPVRSVTPTLVFELGFEGIARSARHKSGIAVRFPRMLRWREDKPVEEADTLQTLAALLPA
ncbi:MULTISPECIES: ATP-dependent DNA ligase [unclassified Variovorax]|uniref:ATP-dependent DNA ligase n=1 Tax=unclassified Variovorax TaxID=663243 RepID=UPI00076BEF17|nr:MULTISPECIES: ATP-dependent DNA ligase [unclassified Variovorax]KWT97977.1 ATP-dependent DNA ligase LigC [Variovorax sp. WDL1]PNG59185.1 DNA ligase B [Variovorax sp. B4]PNG61024.1 DNA ligase B [Variovorax sp. B2]VTV13035.1 Putative DNA ligase-like protein/MT0965 [Variovorax sp. WDL1]